MPSPLNLPEAGSTCRRGTERVLNDRPAVRIGVGADGSFCTSEPHRRDWPQIPGYEVLSELGRGGMAIVYLALQLGLNRPVALKVLLAGDQASGPERLRLRWEAEAVAALQHPNVIQIHEIGEHNGSVYLSLEYSTGGSLDQRIERHPLPPGEAATLVQGIAAGVQAAHEAGIVHRDLKPGNVLLAEDGTPKVTDFGLAQQPAHTLRLTHSGAVVGTPSYMAPEQVLPEPERIGPATDVYGLGCILYECLTGRPPFAAPTTLETMRQVVDVEVVPVRRLQAGVPRDLETICLKCLEKDPGKRYPTARMLADDLARFRTGEPIQARPSGPVERAWRWARRNPVVPLLALTLVLMTLSVAGLMAWSTYHVYQVTGHLRERELYLHGLRGTLLRLDEAQARYVELAAATGDPAWGSRHSDTVAEADRQRADAALMAPEATGAASLLAAAERVTARDQRALDLVRSGRAADAWKSLQSGDYRRTHEDYIAAVGQFADRVDECADAELLQIRYEAFLALASATAVAGLIGSAAVGVWVVYLRRGRRSPT
ncbi:MAG: hypothetical protein C0467_31365 [Planctomycetaceae bacterium]|nr:hypothetical protein [Planctomycetaceae bacterium]